MSGTHADGTPTSGAIGAQAHYHRDLYGALWDDGGRGRALDGAVSGLDQMGHFGSPGGDLVAEELVARLAGASVTLLELGSGFGGAMRRVVARLSGRVAVRLAVGVDVVHDHCRVMSAFGALANDPARCVAPVAVCASVASLGLRGEAFDAVFAAGSASHFPDMAGALGEAFRTLKPGGILTFIEEVSLFDGPPSMGFRALHPPEVFATSSWPARARQLHACGFVDVDHRDLTSWAVSLLRQRLLAMRVYRRQIEDRYGASQSRRLADTLRAALSEMEDGRLSPAHITARRPAEGEMKP